MSRVCLKLSSEFGRRGDTGIRAMECLEILVKQISASRCGVYQKNFCINEDMEKASQLLFKNMLYIAHVLKMPHPWLISYSRMKTFLNQNLKIAKYRFNQFPFIICIIFKFVLDNTMCVISYLNTYLHNI